VAEDKYYSPIQLYAPMFRCSKKRLWKNANEHNKYSKVGMENFSGSAPLCNIYNSYQSYGW